MSCQSLFWKLAAMMNRSALIESGPMNGNPWYSVFTFPVLT